MVYIIGWLGMLISSLLISTRVGRFLSYLVLFYCAFIAFFRGDIGTDTTEYINIFDSIYSGGDSAFGEIGFELVANALNHFFLNPELAVKGVSLLFFTMLFVFLKRSNSNESFLLMAYILPVYAYQYSMNTLRIGVAVALFLLIVQKINKPGASGKNIIASFAPVLFHYSSILLPMLFFVFINRILNIRSFFIFLFLAIISIVILFQFSDYFYSKYILYSNYTKPSMFSGARVIIPLMIILFGLSLGLLSWHEKIKVILLSLFLIFISVVFVQFTYAGLRVLEILSVLIPLVILFKYSDSYIDFDFFIKTALILASIVSATAIYLGFIADYGVGETPFLPYTFSFKKYDT